MKAIVYRDFGSTECLELRDIDTPTPREHEVLVAVHAAGVNIADWYMLLARPRIMRLALGLNRQKQLGIDMAGVVEAVGQDVSRFKPGDKVFGVGRGLTLRAKTGSFAEYVCVPKSAITLMPHTATFIEAAAVPVAAGTALQGLRDHGRIQSGDRVLINGASGGIGTFAVQIAKALGASVTGVCSQRNSERVHAIGADTVIDYAREDFTNSDVRYDVILDIVATRPWSACRRVLSPRGRYVVVGGPPRSGFRLLVLVPFSRGKLVPFIARQSSSDLDAIRELIDDGSVRPVVDRTYPLEKTADAVRYVAAGHTRGKVVITVDHPLR